MFHRTSLIGRIGQDPQMRYTPDGTPVVTISVAVSDFVSKNTNGGGERPCPKGWKESYNGRGYEVTTWYRVTCWRGLAENVSKYLTKGRLVYIEGIMQGEAQDGTVNPRVWTGNDGVARASFELTASLVKFLDGTASAAEPDEEPANDPLPF